MLEESAESFVALDFAVKLGEVARDEFVVEPLMISLGQIMDHVLRDRTTKGSLAEEDELVETLGLDGENESLGESVQVRTSARQLDVLHAGVVEDLDELVSELVIAVVNEEALASKETVFVISEVASDLSHERSVRVRRDPGDFHLACREFDEKHDAVRRQSSQGSIPRQ